jgi:small subunit ribosomal protein S19
MSNESTTFGAKKKKYKGMEPEELKNLSLIEFARIVCSSERRNLVRNARTIEAFIKKAEKKIAKNKTPRTQNREMVIIPKFLDWTINVHNGKEFTPVKITIEMLGHRLGEFAMTRKTVKHGAAGVGATRGTSSLSVK